MKYSLKNNHLIGLAVFGAVSCGVLWKLYNSMSYKNKQEEDRLLNRLQSLECELEKTKKKLESIEELITGKNVPALSSSTSSNSLSVAEVGAIPQVINSGITIVNNSFSDISERNIARLSEKVAIALSSFRQEFHYELRNKLAQVVDLQHKQKLATFEILVGYVLDTNIQQCHDFAVLKALITGSGEVEQDRIYNELKAKALKTVEEILSRTAPLLELPAATPSLDSGSSAGSMKLLVSSAEDIQLIGKDEVADHS